MNRHVNVEVVFLRSVVVMVSATAWILASAEHGVWPSAVTPLFAVLTYVLVDRRRRIRLPVMGANLLGVAAFAAAGVEFYGANLLDKLLSGSHLLVYITWVVLFLQKGIRQFWWLFALCTLQISVASILTNNPAFGASLVAVLLLMIWTLSVFTIYRVRLRLGQQTEGIEDSLADQPSVQSAHPGVLVHNGLQADTDERWLGPRFVGIVGFTFAASLLIGIIAFALFPRIWVPQSELARLRGSSEAVFHQTGFTDNVELGEIGQIMQSDSRVLQFEITRGDDGSTVTPDAFAEAMKLDEILFRGNALGHYRDGAWNNDQIRSGPLDEASERFFGSRTDDAAFHLRIVQDPPISRFAFAPSPVVKVADSEAAGRIRQRRFSYSLIHDRREVRSRNEPVTYEVWCPAPNPGQVRHEPVARRTIGGDLFEMVQRWTRYQTEQRNYALFWGMNPGLEQTLPRLTQLARRICADSSGVSDDREADVAADEPTAEAQLSELTGAADDAERVLRILKFLTDPELFQYSLKADIVDPSIDPVEDFVLNRRTGHCEYFASACALMLQAVGIPARIVNGYKGCDVNTVTGRYEVRQKHAHTWVEAYVDNHWETLDPTPAAARQEEVQQSRSFGWWTDLNSAFSDLWFAMVDRMSPQKQQAMVRPWIDSAKETLEDIRRQGLWKSLQQMWADFRRDPGAWYSGRTWILTFVLLAGLTVLIRYRPDRKFAALFRRLFSMLDRRQRRQLSVVRFYEQFRTVCRRYGLDFPPNQTAGENAAQAVRYFDTQLRDDDRRLPLRIADAFNQVRFGNIVLPEETVTVLKADLYRFSRLLHRDRVE
ncbi:MAG: DUF3488 domain-containing protein [Planctomycetaceae bacterium]|nr:DUF3488 domain-containing protein [Planctomycetaceae bacterium]